MFSDSGFKDIEVETAGRKLKPLVITVRGIK
jgi:hypothetical protein